MAAKYWWQCSACGERGLSKRLVLTKPHLSRLLRSYEKATGRRLVAAG